MIESRLCDDGQRWHKARTRRIRPNVSLTPKGIQHLVLCRDMVMHLLPKGLRVEIAYHCPVNGLFAESA